MSEMIKFPSIDQFRHVIKNVTNRIRWSGKDDAGVDIFDRTKTLPKLQFLGTIKLHGTNSGIVFNDGEIWFQSRNNVITPENDNAGFATYMTNLGSNKKGHEVLRDLVSQINQKGYHLETAANPVCIYGEWCGKGIQKGVAISEVEKMFVIFDIRIGDKRMNIADFANVKLPEYRIFNIMDFDHYYETVDFENPENSQNLFVKITEEVEKECPVGKALGVSGIGEGVVWKCVTPGWESSDFWMKVKGEKHSVSKVKTLASVDIEKVNSINEFVDKTVTENRLQQGIEYLKEQKLEPEPENIGTFIKWVSGDIFKEELDTLIASGLEQKDVGKAISNKARKWFFEQI